MGGGFLLKGGGVSCFFCPTGKKKKSWGFAGLQMLSVRWRQRENPPRGQRVLTGGQPEFPAGYNMVEVMAPIAKYLFAEMYLASTALGLIALWIHLLCFSYSKRAQSADLNTPSNQLRDCSIPCSPGLLLTLVG